MTTKNSDFTQAFIRAVTMCFLTRDKTPLVSFPWEDMDWQTVSEKICQTRVPLLLHHVAGQFPEIQFRIPASIRHDLQKNYYGLLQETVLRQETLKELLALLEQTGLAAIVLRGDVLAEYYYPNPALRPASDIDLLIHPSDLHAFEKVLSGIGVNPIKEHGEVFLYYRDGPLAMNVDLHTGFWYARDMEKIWQRSREVRLSDRNGRILSAEDLLIHLVAHSMIHHGRFALEDALDIALILEKEKTLDWDYIQSSIQGSSFGVFIYGALTRIQDLTGYAIDPRVLARFKPNQFQWIEQKIQELLVQAHERHFVSYLLKPMSIPGFTGKIKFLTEILFPSGRFIRERYELKHEWQIPLVRFFRPLLLLGNAFRAAILVGTGKNNDPRD